MDSIVQIRREIVRQLPVSEKWKRQLLGYPPLYWAIAMVLLLGVVLVLFYEILDDHDMLFVIAEAIHFVGIGFLAYKLLVKKSCAGLSIRTQVLTAIFLSTRLVCSLVMEYDVHTLLDFMTLGATGFVIFTMCVQLKQTYQTDLDTIKEWWVIVPCLLLAVVVHPSTTHKTFFRILWAACVYLESVSVYPQLKMMQNSKIVERFTGHYVFALGLSRFFSCAHWILQLVNPKSYLMSALGTGMWPTMVLLSELVQTLILADFCFWYLKAMARGDNVVRLPTGVV